jgi:hypothetical protein
MTIDDDDLQDYGTASAVQEFVVKHSSIIFPLVLIGVMVGILLIAFYVPDISYKVYGTIQRIDESGFVVKIHRVAADVDPSLVNTEIPVESGICLVASWSAQCFVGAPVEVTVSVSRLGKAFRSVTALIRGSDLNVEC